MHEYLVRVYGYKRREKALPEYERMAGEQDFNQLTTHIFVWNVFMSGVRQIIVVHKHFK